MTSVQNSSPINVGLPSATGGLASATGLPGLVPLQSNISPSPVVTIPAVSSPTSSLAAVVPTGTYPGTQSVDYMKKIKCWIFVILALVVIVIIGWIAKDYNCVQKALCESSWNSQPMLGGILLFISILLTGWFTGKAFEMTTDATTKNFLVVCFVVVALLLILSFFLFYKKANYSSAFYVSLVLVAVVALHTYFSFKVNKNCGYGQLPLLIMSVVLSIYFWDITSKNENGTGPIDCSDECQEEASE
jgi:hypothetical protein